MKNLNMKLLPELGLLDKVNKEGWKSLTAKETGRIEVYDKTQKEIMKQQTQN